MEVGLRNHTSLQGTLGVLIQKTRYVYLYALRSFVCNVYMIYIHIYIYICLVVSSHVNSYHLLNLLAVKYLPAMGHTPSTSSLCISALDITTYKIHNTTYMITCIQYNDTYTMCTIYIYIFVYLSIYLSMYSLIYLHCVYVCRYIYIYMYILLCMI